MKFLAITLIGRVPHPETGAVTPVTERLREVVAAARLFEELLGALRVRLDGDEVSLETAMARLYDGDRGVRRTAA